MKVLLLNQTFYPDNASTSQHATDLALELVKNGFSVDVVSDSRSYDNREVVYPRFENYRGIHIHRISSTALGKKNHFHRGVDYLSFNLALLLKMITLPRYDYVIGLTTPPWISFFGVLFCKLEGGKFIHWAMDVNPDEAVELGWVREGSLFYKLLNTWARFTYKKAYKIVALDKYMAELINEKMSNGRKSNKISVIEPWSHDEITSIEHKENPFRAEHNLDGKFVIMYSGNFSICHPVDTLLNAAKDLKINNNLLFLFIGGGVRLNEILNFKQEHRLDNIIYLPYQNRDNIKYSLSAADLHIVSMGDPYVGIVHPSKIYGILATGRPFVLLGPEKSAIGDMINEHKIGYQVDHGDTKKLMDIVQRVKSMDEDEKITIHKKATELARTRYSCTHRTKKFIDLCMNREPG